MDQLTNTVRRSNWINIIRQCQDRPAGTTAKQWLDYVKSPVHHQREKA